MKTLLGDNFSEVEKYKLYRNVYEIMHPTISKKNISNYKVVLDDKLLPILVYYPKRVTDIKSVIIYIVGDGIVSGSYGKYDEVCKRIAKESDSLVLTIDYFTGNIKYPTTVNKLFRTVKYLYEELDKNNVLSDNITLMGDSTGCKILGGVVAKLVNKNVRVNKMIMFYPVVRDDYKTYPWNEICMNINFGLDKKINNYLKKYISKEKGYDQDLLEMTYLKDFPKTLVVTGDMDILRDDGCFLAEKIINNVEGSRYCNIKFASHGFLSCKDEEILREAYKEIRDFVM